MDIKKYLGIIDRSRLLCNTTEELKHLVEFEVSKNGLFRIGGKSMFIKESVFRQLSHIVFDRYNGLNLQEVLDSYIEADKYLDNLGSLAKNPLMAKYLIGYFYEGQAMPEPYKIYLEGKIKERHAYLLIPMLSKALPRIKEKGGDATDIRQAYVATLDLIINSLGLTDALPMEKLPSIEKMENVIRNSPNQMNRIHLISMVKEIFTEYRGLCNHSNLVEVSRNIYRHMVFPDIKGFWTAKDSTSPFWLFEPIHNGYNLYECIPDNSKKVLNTTKYFAQFFESGNFREATIIHPEAAKYIFERKPVPNYLYSYLTYKIHGDSIEFTPRSGMDCHVNLRKLHKRPKEDWTYFMNIINNYKEQEAFPEYKFQICLSAIKEDYLFVKNPDGGYYKIPITLDSSLKHVRITDNIGITQASGKTYLAFGDEYNLIYDISTPEKLEELGITIVSEI